MSFARSAKGQKEKSNGSYFVGEKRIMPVEYHNMEESPPNSVIDVRQVQGGALIVIPLVDVHFLFRRLVRFSRITLQ